MEQPIVSYFYSNSAILFFNHIVWDTTAIIVFSCDITILNVCMSDLWHRCIAYRVIECLIFQRKSSSALTMDNIDCSSGILLPYYDPDIKVVYLAGKVCVLSRYLWGSFMYRPVKKLRNLDFMNRIQKKVNHIDLILLRIHILM